MVQQPQKRLNCSVTGGWTVKTKTQLFGAQYDQEFIAGPTPDLFSLLYPIFLQTPSTNYMSPTAAKL